MSNLHSMLMGGIVWKSKNKTMPDGVCSDDANANQVHLVNNNPARSNNNNYKCQMLDDQSYQSFKPVPPLAPWLGVRRWSIFHLPGVQKSFCLWDAVFGFWWHVRSQSTSYGAI